MRKSARNRTKSLEETQSQIHDTNIHLLLNIVSRITLDQYTSEVSQKTYNQKLI